MEHRQKPKGWLQGGPEQWPGRLNRRWSSHNFAWPSSQWLHHKKQPETDRTSKGMSETHSVAGPVVEGTPSLGCLPTWVKPSAELIAEWTLWIKLSWGSCSCCCCCATGNATVGCSENMPTGPRITTRGAKNLYHAHIVSGLAILYAKLSPKVFKGLMPRLDLTPAMSRWSSWTFLWPWLPRTC